MRLTSLFAIIAPFFFSIVVSAAVIPRADSTVYSPKIISPCSTTVWKSGTSVHVTWNTANAPPSRTISNHAMVVLHGGPASVYRKLADGFKLTQGWVKVSVPSVPPGHNYTITLFGDSGDISSLFEIAQ